MKQLVNIIVIIGLVAPLTLGAQVDFNATPNDDLGNVTDAFQEHFFKALQQKGIENYDLAVTELQKCLEIDDTKPVIYFQLGKNYNLLKDYDKAETALKKAVRMQPDNVWFLDELYDVYYKQNNVEQAIKTVEQLVDYHPDYKEDLTTLYIREAKYSKALQLLDELDASLGSSKTRQDMRNSIYNASGNENGRIAYLQQQIKNSPKVEDNHLKLIYRYSETGQPEKAYNAAKRLLEIHPNSKLVQLALYKFYLNNGEVDKAINAIKTVLSTTTINADTKTKVLQDFVAFVGKNPQYEADLVTITSIASGAANPKTLANLGAYYTKKGDKTQALKSYENALKKQPNDFKTIKNLVLLQLDVAAYSKAALQTQNALELYPAQPILYLVNGVANNKLQQYNLALDSLEMGLDFIVENPKMEADFYSELSIAYKGLNNITKANAFAKKADAITVKQ